jgi:hypothetical protein
MKLTALKVKTYETWQLLYEVQGAYVRVSTPVQDAVFKQEVRGYGDLRRKATWERAFTSLLAKLLYNYNDDSWTLILLHFLHFPKKEGFTDLTPLLIEQFLMFPYGFDCILKGLQEIVRYGTAGYSTSMSELKAFADEFYSMSFTHYIGEKAST